VNLARSRPVERALSAMETPSRIAALGTSVSLRLGNKVEVVVHQRGVALGDDLPGVALSENPARTTRVASGLRRATVR